jgi:hypothetical protein
VMSPEQPHFTPAERNALLGLWPIIAGVARRRMPDPSTLASLAAHGLCAERVTFGRVEWRLTTRGRLLRAKMLDLCPSCEQPLSGECASWCTDRKQASSPLAE